MPMPVSEMQRGLRQLVEREVDARRIHSIADEGFVLVVEA